MSNEEHRLFHCPFYMPHTCVSHYDSKLAGWRFTELPLLHVNKYTLHTTVAALYKCSGLDNLTSALIRKGLQKLKFIVTKLLGEVENANQARDS